MVIFPLNLTTSFCYLANAAEEHLTVASGVALDMLHRAMPHVLLQSLTMAIKMVCRGGAFVRCRRLFLLA